MSWLVAPSSLAWPMLVARLYFSYLLNRSPASLAGFVSLKIVRVVLGNLLYAALGSVSIARGALSVLLLAPPCCVAGLGTGAVDAIGSAFNQDSDART